MEKKEIDKRIWEAEAEFFKELRALAEVDARGVILKLIHGMKAKLDQIKFVLIDRVELDGIKDMELRMETNPIGCSDLYIDNIIRYCMWLRQVLPARSLEIRKLRKEFKEAKKKE